MRNYLFAAIICGASFAAQAQEVFGLAGALKEQHRSERTFSWLMDYQHRLGEFFAVSGGWINEGHLPGHHRDGPTAQIWARTNAFDRRLTLAAGIGPYVYFDTVPAENADGSHDDHGVGVVATLAATWNFNGPWSIHFRANHIAAHSSVDTTSLLLGVGYRLDGSDAPPRDSSAASAPALDREVALILGKTIVNTLESEDSFAAQFEYRQRLGPYLAWSVAALNEGDARTQRRSGVVAQLWAGRALPDERVTAAIGIGSYVVLDIQKNPMLVEASRERLAGILSLTTAYAPIPHWAVRFTWSRVFTEESHDTDVLLLGVGYRF